jgi:hypothetical protein
MPAADGARPVVVELTDSNRVTTSSAIFKCSLARPFRGATSGGEGTNYAFACSPARVRIITARYLNAIALNTATGVTAAALDSISETGWGFYHCRG